MSTRRNFAAQRSNRAATMELQDFRDCVALPGLGLIAAIGLGGAMLAPDRALACDGLGCVGQAIDTGVRDTGVAIQKGAQATGHVMERGAHDLGTGVKNGVQGAGHAVDDVGQATSRAVTGNP